MFESANGHSQLVTPEAIARTFGAVEAQARLVVLNACYTAPIAEALRAHSLVTAGVLPRLARGQTGCSRSSFASSGLASSPPHGLVRRSRRQPVDL